jgi:hypothetical protein
VLCWQEFSTTVDAELDAMEALGRCMALKQDVSHSADIIDICNCYHFVNWCLPYLTEQ